jgi:hypothetical protein
MEAIQQCRSGFLQAKDQLLSIFAEVPDDRINWSPAATARTPVELVAHAACAVEKMHDMMDGRTFAEPTSAVADVYFREMESGFKTREEVTDLLTKNSDAFIAWLGALPAERVNDEITFPFGLGKGTMGGALPFMADHIRWHAAQLEYLQTAYGDRNWHLPGDA